MRRTMLVAILGLGIGAAGYVIAGEKCGKHKEGAGKETSTHQLPPEVMKELTAIPSYQRADELLKSWSEVPAKLTKLAAMTEGDKSAQKCAGDKAGAHPAKAVFKPTMAYLNNSLALAVELNSAKRALYHANKPEGAVKHEKADGAPCPKATAAKYRGKESAALVEKAHELVLAAYTATGGDKGCAGKSGCSKDGAKAKLTAGEDHPGCPKAAAAAKAAQAEAEKSQAALAAGEGKHECPKAKAAAAAKAAEADKAALAAGEGKHECPKAKAAAAAKAAEAEKSKASLAAGEGPGGCAKAKAAAAQAEGHDLSPKSLSAKADAMIGDSGKLMAKWQQVSVSLASMEPSARQEVELASAEMMNKCPAGSLMPETLSTVQDLLTRAAKLDAQNEAELAKNPEMAKMLTDDMKTLAESRKMVILSALNVIDKTGLTSKAGKRMASAQ